MKEMISSRGELVIAKLLKFYSNPRYLNIIMEIPHDGNHVSLRLLDYFVTNYTKYKQVWIDGIDIHDDYKKMLHGYNKDLFDPFCRKQRIIIYTDDLSLIDDRVKVLRRSKLKLKYKLYDENSPIQDRGIITTIAQLHFFSWCIERKVIMYIIQNSEKIQSSMTSIHENKKVKGGVYQKEMKFKILFN